MKKAIISCLIFIILLATGSVFAVEQVSLVSDSAVEQKADTEKSELLVVKEKSSQEIQDYIDRYGSEAYGVTAFVLNKVRIYSIPFCFIGIAIGAIYQYVIGIRRLDVRDKGFSAVIAFVTILIICQVLPLIFAIVVKGWRG